ncbi:MAG: ABC transporter ATP-binding protein [Tannerellaceae bacterium]|jgi:ABC-2 type transport system ATP-binding protein|nr:ABC transporter ATP-binding protein [Tannerellaceae bacterium]
MEHAIQVHQLTKRYGSFVAVDHISFDVRKGEIFGFLGANGAGKTTAMRMLCGTLTPSSGTISLDGNNGYMSQRFSLYQDLTVDENLRYFAAIYGLRATDLDSRSHQLLQQLHFLHARHTPVKDLPLGWKQKTAFAAAIIHRPQILFLDEPTAGVDPLTRRRFWELIYREADHGMTIFVTTHYMDEAEYCHRLSIMVAGRIAALDTPANLKERFHASSIDDVFQQLVGR